MTQDQIADYLMKRMFKYSGGSIFQGVLTSENIQSYLSFIGGTVAKTLAKGHMDILEIDDFVDMVEPIVAEMSEPETLTEEEETAFLNEIQQFAERYLSDRQIDFNKGIESVQEIENKEIEKTTEDVAPLSGDADRFLMQEIIPIGFEKGAPRVSISVFFEFPFGKESGKKVEHFGQHLRYLEEAVGLGVLGADELSKIRSMVSSLPTLIYRKNYDIYPFDRFEETVLLIVFSLWQNKVLKTQLIKEVADSSEE